MSEDYKVVASNKARVYYGGKYTFMSQYSNPGNSPGEVNDSPSQTVQIGAVPTRQLVEQFIHTGKVAQAAREGFYDFEDEPTEEQVDNFDDPTRNPDFDEFQAYDMARAAVEKVMASRDAREKERMETFKKQQQQQQAELESLRKQLAELKKNEPEAPTAKT